MQVTKKAPKRVTITVEIETEDEMQTIVAESAAVRDLSISFDAPLREVPYDPNDPRFRLPFKVFEQPVATMTCTMESWFKELTTTTTIMTKKTEGQLSLDGS